MGIFARAFVLAGIACASLSLPAAAQTVGQSSAGFSPPVARPVPGSINWLYAWSGLGVSNSSTGGYIGALAPLNGNLATDGIAFRFDFAGTRYDYTNSFAPFAGTRIDTTSGSVMAGYRKQFGESWLGGYVGGAYESHDNPDPGAVMRGTQTGAKVLGEYYTPLGSQFESNGLAFFSSPFSTYFADAKVGYKVVNNIVVGPEGSVFRDTAYSEARLGGYVGFKTAAGQIDLAAGYVHPLTTSPDGYYASVNFGLALNR
jgi:hypothetical protein